MSIRIPIRPTVDVEGGKAKREAAAKRRSERRANKEKKKEQKKASKAAEQRHLERELQRIRQEAADWVFSHTEYYGAHGLGSHEGIEPSQHQNPRVDLGWFSKPKTVWYPITTTWGRWGCLVWKSSSPDEVVFEQASGSLRSWDAKMAEKDTKNRVKNVLQPQAEAKRTFESHGYQAFDTQIVNTSQGERVVRVQLQKDKKCFVGTFIIGDSTRLKVLQVQPNEFKKQDWWRNK